MALPLLRKRCYGLGAVQPGIMQMSIEILHLVAENELPAVQFTRPYLAVLWIQGAVSAEWQRKVSEWLVETGCLYVIAWKGGVGGHGWIESVKAAKQKASCLGKIPQSTSVVTDCHEYVAMKEVLTFAEHEALHPREGRLRPVMIVV